MLSQVVSDNLVGTCWKLAASTYNLAYLMFALLPLRIKLFNRAYVVHLGISDHSLIYATRKLNSVIKGNSQNSVEFRNFRKFNVESFLSDLYMLPWVELDCKQNVDEMWECWKTLFRQVLDKHAPKR